MLDEIIIPQKEGGTTTTAALSALANLAGTREVEIDLPLLKTRAIVQPVSGSEELRLHTMRASGAAFIESFNKVLFEHTTFDKLKFESVQDFQDHLTPPDKALLVYALLDATFTVLPEKMIKCPGCDKTDTYTPSPAELFHGDSVTDVWVHEASFEDYEIKSEIVPGFTVFYKMPTETDRINILKSKENSEMRDSIDETGNILSSMELFAAYIKRIEIVDNKEVISLTDTVKDIIPTIVGMPLELQAKLLNDETIEEFVKYSPNFYLDISCTNPGCSLKTFKWTDVNPEQDFFRKALSVYN